MGNGKLGEGGSANGVLASIFELERAARIVIWRAVNSIAAYEGRLLSIDLQRKS
jgi:hypothetical protein